MLNRVYELETALHRSALRASELETAVRQAKFDLRAAQQAQAEYSGIRALLDKLSGKHPDKAEALARQVRKEEAKLHALLRQQKAEQRNMSALQEQRASLPPLEQLRTPENAALWAKPESRYCAEVLLPLLQKNYDALLEYRSLLQGQHPVISVEEQQRISAAPNTCAAQSLPWLTRLREAMELQGTPLDPGGYYSAPESYLVTAAKHNRFDRVNAALDQILALQKQARTIMDAE